MLIPFPPAALGAALSALGWLSSALRLSGRARAHSPGLTYFFKGGSLILVGLGGKEDWGFVKCPLRRSFIGPDFLLPPGSSRLPSLSKKPSCPGPGLLCLLSLPSYTAPFFFLFFSFFSFFFLFFLILFLSASLLLGFQRWEGGPTAAQLGRLGPGSGLHPPSAPSPLLRRNSRLGAAQGLGLDLAKACCVCLCRGNVHCWEAAGGAGWGVGGGERQMQIYIKNK